MRTPVSHKMQVLKRRVLFVESYDRSALMATGRYYQSVSAPGDPGLPGQRGTFGEHGPKGERGDPGLRGPPGNMTDIDMSSMKGDKGDAGPQGTAERQTFDRCCVCVCVRKESNGMRVEAFWCSCTRICANVPFITGTPGNTGEKGYHGEPGKPGMPGKEGMPGSPGQPGKSPLCGISPRNSNLWCFSVCSTD